MFAAAFASLGLPHTYEARAVDAAGLAELVESLRRGEIHGMNVTVPHKLRALALADRAEDVATRAGAANVLARAADGRVVADNTDVAALASEIRRLGPVIEPSRRALILGSGGGARAAVLALAEIGFARITIRARSRAKAESLLALGVGIRVDVEALAPANDADIAAVVQATSAGMSGEDSGEDVAHAVAWGALDRTGVAYDLVYTPPVTPLVAAARAHGLRAESGLGMLVHQAGLALERWLGMPAPLDAMRGAATSSSR
jgi:shikimate dehydrogenase